MPKLTVQDQIILNPLFQGELKVRILATLHFTPSDIALIKYVFMTLQSIKKPIIVKN